jgi:cytochrome c peroxidase
VPPSFTLLENSRSNGLEVGEPRIFKSPTLNCLPPGQPMMHEGRPQTLERVVNHFKLGVKNGEAQDPALKDR